MGFESFFKPKQKKEEDPAVLQAKETEKKMFETAMAGIAAVGAAGVGLDVAANAPSEKPPVPAIAPASAENPTINKTSASAPDAIFVPPPAEQVTVNLGEMDKKTIDLGEKQVTIDAPER